MPLGVRRQNHTFTFAVDGGHLATRLPGACRLPGAEALVPVVVRRAWRTIGVIDT